MRILVTGASGLLGLNFALHYSGQHTIIGAANQHILSNVPFEQVQVDLTRKGMVGQLVDAARPELVLHCAALANLEAAEKDPALAARINGEVPGEFADLSRRLGIRLVHISTDAVFDGQRGEYSEEDAPNPINVYARSKLAGEQAVAQAYPDSIIARVNFFGWSLSGKRSLAEFFFNNLQAGRSVNGFTDVVFCPLQVNILGGLLLEMVRRELRGLYHVLSSEKLSKFDFGRRIAQLFGFDPTLVNPVSWVEAGLAAPRSPNLTLRVNKLAQDLDYPDLAQAAGLERFFQEFEGGLAGQIRRLGEVETKKQSGGLP